MYELVSLIYALSSFSLYQIHPFLWIIMRLIHEVKRKRHWADAKKHWQVLGRNRYAKQELHCPKQQVVVVGEMEGSLGHQLGTKPDGTRYCRVFESCYVGSGYLEACTYNTSGSWTIRNHYFHIDERSLFFLPFVDCVH